MFAKERQEEIVCNLNKYGKVRVKELSEKFKVTEDCIRKDLAFLEKRGILKRSYGGAVIERSNVHRFDVNDRKEINIKEKKIIAEKAVELINDNDMVFLDISTINIEIAKLILALNKKVTVVSNMVEIINLFSSQNDIRFICIGGFFNINHDGFVGGMSTDIISKFKFDISFLGTVGIDVHNNNVSTYDVNDGITKNRVVELSEKAYLVSETNKFNMDGNYNYTHIDNFTGIITNEPVKTEILEVLSKYSVKLI